MRKLTLEQKRGARDALLSAAPYALGFIATKFALDAWGPITVIFMSTVTATIGGIVMLAMKKQLHVLNDHWQVAGLSGLFYAAELFAITFGLTGTTVSSGVFISNTYVVFVPFFVGFNPFSLNGARHLAFISVALIGVAFVSELTTLDFSQQGNMFCLATAVLTAAHFAVIQRATKKITSPIAFNICQSGWAAMYAAFALCFSSEQFVVTSSALPWLAVLCCGLVSNLGASVLQVRAQMRIGATASSLLYLMDAPFAAAFGMLLLNENVSLTQSLGAALILTASLGQFYFDWRTARLMLLKANPFRKSRNIPKNPENLDEVA